MNHGKKPYGARLWSQFSHWLTDHSHGGTELGSLSNSMTSLDLWVDMTLPHAFILSPSPLPSSLPPSLIPPFSFCLCLSFTTPDGRSGGS